MEIRVESIPPYADGTLIVPVDISGLTAPMELIYQANWDIQGGNYDNLVVMISQDNGSSWTMMSPLPGVPAHGIGVGGTTYNQHSWGLERNYPSFPSLGSREFECFEHFAKIPCNHR